MVFSALLGAVADTVFGVDVLVSAQGLPLLPPALVCIFVAEQDLWVSLVLLQLRALHLDVVQVCHFSSVFPFQELLQGCVSIIVSIQCYRAFMLEIVSQ